MSFNVVNTKGCYGTKVNLCRKLMGGFLCRSEGLQNMNAWVLVAMETHFYVFPLKYQYFEKFFEGTLLKIKFAKTFPQYVL